MKKQNRKHERLLLILISIIVSMMFYQFYQNVEDILIDAEKDKNSMQLAADFSEKKMKELLQKGEYFMDSDYERYLARKLKAKMKKAGRISNLGQLNKKPFLVEATEMATEGGDWGKARYQVSATKLGLDSTLLENINTIYKDLNATQSISDKKTDIRIYGKVKIEPKQKGIIDRILKRDKSAPATNVLVRLSEEITSLQKDSILTNFIANCSQEELFHTDLDSLIKTPSYYVRTDTNGFFEFNNLTKGKNYSVIPIGIGKEYGKLRGKASITESEEFNFKEKAHTLPLFDRYTFKRIKSDKKFTVRTPETFTKNLLRTLIFFLLAFWLFHIAMSVKGKPFEQSILPLLMLLTGVGMVVLYAIQEPLRDMDYASSISVLLLGLMILFSLLVFVVKEKWVNAVAKFRIKSILGKFAIRKGWLNKEARGYEWLVLSVLLMLALLLLGTGPEGSGVKVNLFGVQVSELSKYLMIIFFAKYFSANTRYFRKIPSNRWLFKNSLLMFIGFILLIGIYAILGDLGPALVLCITFLFFYAYAKGEFPQMVSTAILYTISLFLISFIIDTKTIQLSIYAAVIVTGLIVYSFIVKKNESMFFITMIISSFIFLENLPFSFAKRLADRNSMFRNLWDNSLHGGDQVAQGIWSINSGGLTGKGLGNGMSNVMPAYHTDMIFESIGEELGIIVMIGLLFAFGLLFWRTMLVARRTGQTFFFYLINGVAISTLVQLSIIVGGSLGLIPLTGISVPFLSKGNSSLLINTFFFLTIILLSQFRGKSVSMEKIRKDFDTMNVAVLLTFIGILLLFSITLFKYNYTRDTSMIRPVKVLTKQGEWINFYNPRIEILKKDLKLGNIYDRNGILLATSDRDTFVKWGDSITNKKGKMDFYVDKATFYKQKSSRLSRYYPYDEDLIYYLGDWNTGLVTNGALGYVADYRLMDELRGFDHNEATISTVMSEEYKEASYLPKEQKETLLKTYDYSKYIPYIKAGKNSKIIDKFNAENKDIKLSLDVKMNQMINEVIRADLETGEGGLDLNKYKISVVALNAKTGEVLASAMNPKPSKKDIMKINQIPYKYYNKLFNAYFGYEGMVADRDLGIFHRTIPGSTIKPINAMAYLSRDGVDSVAVSYYITKKEAILKKLRIYPGKIDMIKAIQHSSNVYFIRLMNEKEFHPELFEIYEKVGINLFDEGGFYLNPNDSYDFDEVKKEWTRGIMKEKGLNYNNERYIREKSNKRYRQSHYSFMAWGQDPIKATPLQMARVYGAIAMDGKLKKLNIVDSIGGKNQLKNGEIELLKNTAIVNSKNIADTIEFAMKRQSKRVSDATQIVHYGKTGTSERKQRYYNRKKRKISTKKVVDGWYVCYIKDTSIGDPLVFATRIEGMPESSGGSGNAVKLWRKIAEKLKADYFNKTQ